MRKTLTFGVGFSSMPGFEEKLRRSEKLSMFGHKVGTLSREELLACIVLVQDERDAVQKKLDELERKIVARVIRPC